MVVVPILLGVSTIFLFNAYKSLNLNGKMLLEAENDYRLKFVTSADFEFSLGETNKVILPFEIIDVCEIDGSIKVTSTENAVVLSPITCVVNSVSRNGEIELGVNNIRIIISGLISGVKAGNKISCGDCLGTLRGDSCFVKVFWGTRKLSLEELKALL